MASCELDACFGAPEPHGFAVRKQARSSVTLLTSTASHPTFVTIASRPSWQGGMATAKHIFPKNGSEIFFTRGLDRISQPAPDGRWPANSCQSVPRKILYFRFSEKCVFLCASRPEQRGVTAKSSRNVGRGAVDAGSATDERGLLADGEAVWFWRPFAGVKFARTPKASRG